jgi:uncharacterized protein YciI
VYDGNGPGVPTEGPAGDAIMAGVRLLALVLLGCVSFGQQSAFRMSPYVVGVRRKGPAWTPDMNSPEAKRMLAGHIKVIEKMEASGKLVAAGPFSDAAELRGLLIFRDCTIDEARKMAEEDPAVTSGRISIQFHNWMAAPGLKKGQ